MRYLNKYRGIIIQSNDPNAAGRVKVFVPHVNATLYEEWNKELKNKQWNGLGSNVRSGITAGLKVRLQENLPWADVEQPLIGGGGGGYTWSGNDQSTVQDSQDIKPTNSPDAPPVTELPGDQIVGSSPEGQALQAGFEPLPGETPLNPDPLNPNTLPDLSTETGLPSDIENYTAVEGWGTNYAPGEKRSDDDTDAFHAAADGGSGFTGLAKPDGTLRSTQAGDVGVVAVNGQHGPLSARDKAAGRIRYGTTVYMKDSATPTNPNPKWKKYIAIDRGGAVESRVASRAAGRGDLPVFDKLTPESEWGKSSKDGPQQVLVGPEWQGKNWANQTNSQKEAHFANGINTVNSSSGSSQQIASASTSSDGTPIPATALPQSSDFANDALFPNGGDIAVTEGDVITPVGSTVVSDDDAGGSGGQANVAALTPAGAGEAENTGAGSHLKPVEGSKGVSGSNHKEANPNPNDRSATHSNGPKGIMSNLEVGSHVWVSFEQGDPQYPIVTGYMFNKDAHASNHDLATT